MRKNLMFAMMVALICIIIICVCLFIVYPGIIAWKYDMNFFETLHNIYAFVRP